jgi:hypothetical protein
MSEDYMISLRDVPHGDRMLKVMVDILMELKEINRKTQGVIMGIDYQATPLLEAASAEQKGSYKLNKPL